MAIKERKQITGTTAQIQAYAGHEGQIVWDKEKKTLVGMSGTAGKNYPLAPKEYVDSKVAKVNAKLTEGLAGKEDKGTCLPLTGGQMTGNIGFNTGAIISGMSAGGDFRELLLGSDAQEDPLGNPGAFIALRNSGGSFGPLRGSFTLHTRLADATIPYALEGKTNGDLTWGGKPIIREVSEGRNSEGGNYFVSFSNGLKIQTVFVHSTGNPVTVNYWTPFTQNPAIYVTRIGGHSSLDGFGVEWFSYGNTSAKITKATGHENIGFFLLAIGY